jgi:hypothetical protein
MTSGSSSPAKKSSQAASSPAAVRPTIGIAEGPSAGGCSSHTPFDAGSVFPIRARSALRAARAADASGATPAAENLARISRACCDNRVSPSFSGGSAKGVPAPVRSHLRSAPVASAIRATSSAGAGRPFS